MKKVILLLTLTLLVTTGCSFSFSNDGEEKFKKEITESAADAVADKVSEELKEGVDEGVDKAKEEIVAELTAKDIKIYSDKIDPTSIEVMKDEEVKLKVESDDDKTHGFYLPDFDVTETVESGKTKTVTFTADKKGTFTYSCNLNCDSNVSGSLIVK